MSDLNEDLALDETTAKIRAQEGYELVLQIPSLLKGMKHLVSEFERIDREIKELSDLPGKVELFGEDVILVKAQMIEIKNHIESIPKLLEVLSNKIDVNSKIATDTASLLQDKVLGPSEKIIDWLKKWAIDLAKKSVYLFGALIAALYYDAANTISEMIKAAL